MLEQIFTFTFCTKFHLALTLYLFIDFGSERYPNAGGKIFYFKWLIIECTEQTSAISRAKIVAYQLRYSFTLQTLFEPCILFLSLTLFFNQPDILCALETIFLLGISQVSIEMAQIHEQKTIREEKKNYFFIIIPHSSLSIFIEKNAISSNLTRTFRLFCYRKLERVEKQTSAPDTPSSHAKTAVNKVLQRSDGQGAAGTPGFNDDPPSSDADNVVDGGTRVKQEPEDDFDVICEDGDNRNENWYRPERIIQPPEFDEEMRASDQQILDDIQEQVGVPYEAPEQIRQIVANFHTARQRDPRRNGTRNMEASKPRTRYAWSQQQEQQMVAMTLLHLSKGFDMTTIKPYIEMKRLSPLFRNIDDPRQIKRRLQALCSPQNSAILEDYCGHSIAANDDDRQMAIAVAQTIRASCLDLYLVKQQGLDKFIRPKILTTRRKRNPSTQQTVDDDVQIVDPPALPAPPPTGKKRVHVNQEISIKKQPRT